MKNQKISKATMARFPIYLKALRNMQLEGKANFLSSELSEVTGVLDTTIRRDFSFLTEKESLGRRGIGYDTKTVIDILNNTLGLGLDEPIVLIGDGTLVAYSKLKDVIDNIAIATPSIRYQSAANVCVLAAEKIENGYEGSVANDILPNYLRLSQAERELKKK